MMPQRSNPATRPQRPQHHNGQSGLGTIGLVGVLVGIGIVFLTVFLFANAGTDNKAANQGGQTGDQTNRTEAKTNEPPYIRVPDNSLVYKNSTYKFSFAYPNSFSKLADTTAPGGSDALKFKSESAIAAQKPVGTTGAVLTGKFGAYVYSKDDFKILVGDPEIFVAPTKTGNSITWKVVSTGATTQNIKVGDAFPVKTIKSQTGVPVFNFTLSKSTSSFGRYVFEAGDYYVIVSLPLASKPNNGPLSDGDLAAYNIIGTNLATTVRVQATSTAPATDSGASGSGSDHTNTGNTNQPN